MAMVQEFEVMVDKLTTYRFCTYEISLSQKYSEITVLWINGGLEMNGTGDKALSCGHYC